MPNRAGLISGVPSGTKRKAAHGDGEINRRYKAKNQRSDVEEEGEAGPEIDGLLAGVGVEPDFEEGVWSSLR